MHANNETSATNDSTVLDGGDLHASHIALEVEHGQFVDTTQRLNAVCLIAVYGRLSLE